jgi:hypothetical protein
MTGLILLAALTAFIAFLIWLSGPLTRWLPLSSNWKANLRVLIVVGAFPLILADEIVGKRQFEALCTAYGIESADFSSLRSARVRLEFAPPLAVKNSIVPIDAYEFSVINVDANELVVRYKDYYAHGGWLMRYTPLSLGSPRPMLFSSSCPNNRSLRPAILEKFGISIVE